MFNEANSVEHLIRDLLSGDALSFSSNPPTGFAQRVGRLAGCGFHFVSFNHLPRPTTDASVEVYTRDALIRLNPEITANPDYADEVLYRLRAITLSVRSSGLVSANEEMAFWLRGDRSMPFGKNHEHVSVKLIDFDNPENNQYVVTTQYTFRAGSEERRADLVLLVNGFPLVLIEAKTPVRRAVSWFDGVKQIHDDYEKSVPELFVANVFSVATEGKALRYGSVGMPPSLWGPWHPDEDDEQVPSLSEVRRSVEGLLRPEVVLDILANFTLFANDQKKRRYKVVCRYQQYEAANKIVARVAEGRTRKGLIWHFQGSGKSLLMVFAAQKLRLTPELKNPAVLIVVDRVDLDSQISGTFHASDVPNLIKAESRAELERLLRQDTRKIIITTIHKFAEAEGVLNSRGNLVVLVDEAHRTQEGDLGRKMREALPHAFLFGLTGTPINKRDRNTFYAFGAEEDERGYLSRYSFEASTRDQATLPLHFEPRLLELRIDKEAVDQAYARLTGGLSDTDRETLARTASRLAVIVKAPARIARIAADVAGHFKAKVEPNGFKGMVVTFDQETCLLYKEALDEHFPKEASEIVISATGGNEALKPFERTRDQEEGLLNRFRDPSDPLKLLIVTAKLLTGFDAPILQALYLDKPLKEHSLLQTICRTNRTYGETKSHGLIVDYIGVFDDVARSLAFDEKAVENVVTNISALKDQLGPAVQACLGYFPELDRTVAGYEGLIAAQERLPDNETRDAFAADYSVLNRLWEALSPDPVLGPLRSDYRWLSQVYESVKPSGGSGQLLWHTLGAKTVALIHENVSVDEVDYDLESVVLDEALLGAVLDPKRKAKEVEVKVAKRLRGLIGHPAFKKLSKRLEELRERHEQGLLHSVEFLKALLVLAQDLLKAEREEPAAVVEEPGRSALTELFQEVRTDKVPIVVERIVTDIDEIVRQVRFPDWQQTSAGERLVRKALRSTLLKYQLHKEQELFDKAYGYIREYY